MTANTLLHSFKKILFKKIRKQTYQRDQPPNPHDYCTKRKQYNLKFNVVSCFGYFAPE